MLIHMIPSTLLAASFQLSIQIALQLSQVYNHTECMNSLKFIHEEEK